MGSYPMTTPLTTRLPPDRIESMKNRISYSVFGVLLVFFAIVAALSYSHFKGYSHLLPGRSNDSIDLVLTALAGVGTCLAGLMMWRNRERTTSSDDFYCANCGQYLGAAYYTNWNRAYGGAPLVCPKCGSNRYARRDPGVGTAVRIR